MKGTVFSIEEFSTFDGPGIRCSVFLKGCPLKCQWCHNPEGQSFAPQILRGSNGCIGCGTCIRTGMTEESILQCPRQLLRKCGQEYTPSELIDKLSPHLPMLNAAGGGITFSGGEPLAQGEFLLACLKLLEGQTHRAVQTSGYGSNDLFTQILSNTDYVLFDLKLMDDTLHRKYTGVSNRIIFENYRRLCNSGLPFITRIPLIPGVNDTVENLQSTANYMTSLGANRLELLPYNQAAGAKYASTGRSYKVDFDPDETPNPHLELFNQYNIEVTVL